MTIFNGTYTINNPATGQHRTLRIKTQANDARFAPGRRVIQLMNGPDNERSFENFGFVNDDSIRVFRKHEGTDFEKLAKMLWSLWTLRNQSPYKVQFNLSLIESCTCRFCNRKLTDVLSALTGVGPECAEMRAINRERLPKREPLTGA